MPDPNYRTNQSRGRRALERASNTATGRIKGGGVPKAQLAPEVWRMKEQGMTVPAIAKAVKRSDRYVRMLLAFYRENLGTMFMELPDPRKREELGPEYRAMTEYTTQSFVNFFNAFATGGERVAFPEHARSWVDSALANRNMMLNVPPRHAKSTIMSVWFPIWLLCCDRNHQVIIISNTVSLAKIFTNEIAYNLSYNQELIRAFGRFKPELVDWPWRPNSGELLIEGRSRETKSGALSIQVRGSGQQIFGMEATWVIVDDCTDAQISRSETQRLELEDWLHQQVLSRLEPGGHAVVIGQRVHPRDIYGSLEAEVRTRGPNTGQRVWNVERYPAVRDWDTNEVLWPDKWTMDELMEVYDRIGGYATFECMYQQNPLAEGEALVRPEWIEGSDTHPGCVDRDRSWGVGIPRGVLPIVRVLSIDPSPTRYNALIVADLFFNRNEFYCHVIEIVRGKMQMRDLIAEMDRLVDQYAPMDYLVFEQSGFSRWLFEDPFFERIKSKARIIGHNTYAKGKGDPEMGVWALAGDFEFGRISLPYEDAESKAQSRLLTEEALIYPFGETDDVLMALWFMKFNYKKLIPTRDLPTNIRGADLEKDSWGWWRAAKAHELRKKMRRVRRIR